MVNLKNMVHSEKADDFDDDEEDAKPIFPSWCSRVCGGGGGGRGSVRTLPTHSRWHPFNMHSIHPFIHAFAPFVLPSKHSPSAVNTSLPVLRRVRVSWTRSGKKTQSEERESTTPNTSPVLLTPN